MRLECSFSTMRHGLGVPLEHEDVRQQSEVVPFKVLRHLQEEQQKLLHVLEGVGSHS